MHVERDAARGCAIDRDSEGLDRGMPALLVHDRGERHVEELGVEVEDRLPHRLVFEVRPHFLRVVAEALRLHAVRVVRLLPLADRRRAGLVQALLLEEQLELGHRHRPRDRLDVAQEAVEALG